MEQFEFISKEEAFNGGRSGFANNVCKLLYQKHKGNLDEVIKDKDCEVIFEGFKENVRNIYELIETEIPLYAFYGLQKYGADNWGFDDNEYKKAIMNTVEACRIYYI